MKAIITGATRGIGKAIAMELAEQGYDLGLGARNLEVLNLFRKEIQLKYPKIEVITKSVDFSQKHETHHFAETFINYWGTIDVLINNVGKYEEDNIEGLTENDLMNTLNINFFSAFRLTQLFIPEFKKNKFGHIINICSVLSKKRRRRAVSYTLSKHMLYNYTKTLRDELSSFDVKVTAILPGSTNTTSWDGIDAPVESFVQPKDVADGVIMVLKSRALVEEIEINPINRAY